MTRRERTWCLAYAALLAAVTTLPYLLGYSFQGEAWRFTGFVFGVEDGNSYIAKMLLGSSGDWLFRTPYTSMAQRGVLAYLPYLLLGKLAAGPGLHEQLVFLYHLFRVTAIPAGVLATYQFSALFLDSPRWRRWVTILATAGGGLGWLLVILGQTQWLGSLPLEFYSPESFGFLAIYGLPHLVLARALFVLGLLLYLQASKAPKKAWWAGICFLALGLVQPVSLVTAGALIAIHQLIFAALALTRRRWNAWVPWFGAAWRVGMVVLPLVVYLVLAFTGDAFLKAWSSQNRILSPHALHYLLAYGLMLPFALAGAVGLIKGSDQRGWLLVAWIAAFPFLAYAPHNLQRRFPEGVWVAFVLLGAIGLERYKGLRWKRWAKRGLLVMALPSSFLLVAGGVITATNPREPAFRPAQEVEAFTWLGEQVPPHEAVLSAYQTGNALPAWAPLRVILGHGPETADLEHASRAVGQFYDDGTPEEARHDLIDSFGVDLFWLGPRERDVGSWAPDDAEHYTGIYQQGGIEIYRVNP